MRPSGHPAHEMHAERWELAEQMDAEAGIVYGAATVPQRLLQKPAQEQGRLFA